MAEINEFSWSSTVMLLSPMVQLGPKKHHESQSFDRILRLSTHVDS